MVENLFQSDPPTKTVRYGRVNSKGPLLQSPNTAKNRRRTDPFGLRRIDFSNSDDRWIFKKTIQEHLGSIVFLLQDEKFYASPKTFRITVGGC